jgi:hypothetical protein
MLCSFFSTRLLFVLPAFLLLLLLVEASALLLV